MCIGIDPRKFDPLLCLYPIVTDRQPACDVSDLCDLVAVNGYNNILGVSMSNDVGRKAMTF